MGVWVGGWMDGFNCQIDWVVVCQLLFMFYLESWSKCNSRHIAVLFIPIAACSCRPSDQLGGYHWACDNWNVMTAVNASVKWFHLSDPCLCRDINAGRAAAVDRPDVIMQACHCQTSTPAPSLLILTLSLLLLLYIHALHYSSQQQHPVGIQ